MTCSELILILVRKFTYQRTWASNPALRQRGGGERRTLRRVAAATEAAVSVHLAGLVELRHLRPYLVDRGQGASRRRTAVDGAKPSHQLWVIGFGGLAEEGVDLARPWAKSQCRRSNSTDRRRTARTCTTCLPARHDR